MGKGLSDLQTAGGRQVLSEMIERAGIPMYQHAMLTLEGWLKDLPPSLADNRAGLLSLRGVVEHIKGNASEGVRLLDLAISKLRRQKDIPGLALALIRRGNALRFLGNYPAVIQDAAETMKITEGKDDLQSIYAAAMRLHGLSLFRQGQTRQAIDFLERALDIHIRVNDVETVPVLQMETGMVQAALGNYREAKDSYEKALQIWRRSGNLISQADLLNNFGFLYYQLGEYEKAAAALEEGLLCAQRSGYKRMEALISISMGDLYSEVEDFEIAAQNYGKVNDLVQQLGDQFLIHYLLIAEANLALLRRDTARARNILGHAGKLIKANEFELRIRTLSTRARPPGIAERKPSGCPYGAFGSSTLFYRGWPRDGEYLEQYLAGGCPLQGRSARHGHRRSREV